LRKQSAPVPTRHFASLVLRNGKQILLRQRSEEGLLGGLWEFPNLETDAEVGDQALQKRLRKEFALSQADLVELPSIQHTYSHFHAQVRVYAAQVPLSISEKSGFHVWQWTELSAMGELPMGKIDRSIAKQITADVG